MARPAEAPASLGTRRWQTPGILSVRVAQRVPLTAGSEHMCVQHASRISCKAQHSSGHPGGTREVSLNE